MNKPSSKDGSPSRRTVIKGLLGVSLGAAVGPALDKSSKAIDKFLASENHPESKEKEPGLSVALDTMTALGVFAAFADQVFIKGAYKEQNLNGESIALVGSAAAIRIAALDTLGGKEGKELAAKELHEITEGLIPVPVLVLLSDITSSELKVDAEAIFREVEKKELSGSNQSEKAKAGTSAEAMENTKREADTPAEAMKNTKPETSPEKMKRPKLEAPLEEWEKYLEKVNNDLVDKVAQISGLCAVFAPLSTTYTSSALANELKKDVAHILYEQSYAHGVVDFQKNYPDSKLTNKLAQQHALDRSNELFNGPLGFSNLMLTLACNIQGTWAWGDPPEVYFAKKHGKHFGRMAKATAFGFANAEVLTMALNTVWLKRAGLSAGRYTKKFFGAQYKAIQAVGGLAGTNQRSVALNEGRRFAERLENTLKKKAENSELAKEALKVIQSIPDAKLQFSFRDYLQKKFQLAQKFYQEKISKEEMLELPDDKTFSSLESFAENDFIGNLRNEYQEDLKSGQGKSSKKTLGKLMKAMETAHAKIQQGNVDRLTDLLSEIGEAKDLNAELLGEYAKSKEFTGAKNEAQVVFNQPLDPEMQERLDHALAAIEKVKKDFTITDSETRMERLAEALNVGISTEGGAEPYRHDAENKSPAEKVYNILSIPDRETYEKAVKQLTDIKHKEQKKSSSQQIKQTTAEVDEVRQKTNTEHHASFLSHSAKEVFFALMTQVPSVPAMARLVQKVIPMMVGLEDGQKPTQNQLKAIIFLTLTLTALLSAFADNVAAWMFGEEVLSKFFEDAYGKKVLEEQPDIMDMVSIASLKVAENAGGLSKIGNGANLSQKKYTIVADDKSEQSIRLEESEPAMKENLLIRNGFATAANLASIGIYGGLLAKKLVPIPTNDTLAMAA